MTPISAVLPASIWFLRIAYSILHSLKGRILYTIHTEYIIGASLSEPHIDHATALHPE